MKAISEQVERAVGLLGGNAGAARRIGVSKQMVWRWRTGEPMAPERVHQLAEATDYRVTPHQLRPDIFREPTDSIPRAAA